MGSVPTHSCPLDLLSFVCRKMCGSVCLVLTLRSAFASLLDTWVASISCLQCSGDSFFCLSIFLHFSFTHIHTHLADTEYDTYTYIHTYSIYKVISRCPMYELHEITTLLTASCYYWACQLILFFFFFFSKECSNIPFCFFFYPMMYTITLDLMLRV